MKKLLACNKISVAFILVSPIAIAAVPYDWSGFYIGVNAGGAFSQANPTTTTTYTGSYFLPADVASIAANGSEDFNTTTATFGVQGGYNWQKNNFVYGISTAFNYFNPNGSSSVTTPYPGFVETYTITQSVSSNWLFTALPRIGVVSNKWLFYVTGGLAVTDMAADFSFTDNFSNASESASISTTKAGWVAGTGVEVKLNQRWSINAEYLYMDFGKATTNSNNLVVWGQSANPSNPFTHSMELQSQMILTGINYHFTP